MSAYHIHERPVPESGNCNDTGKHFDKYGVTDEYKCDKSQPQLCQLGDLSGKHGIIAFNPDGSDNSNNAYHDDFLSTSPENIAYFGNLSVVVHRRRDSFRLACGNFALFWDASGGTVTGAMPFETDILANDVTTNSTISGAPFPNTTTSTEVVISTASGTGGSARSTITDVRTASSQSSASYSPSSARSSASNVQTGYASRGIRVQLMVLALDLVAVVMFVRG